MQSENQRHAVQFSVQQLESTYGSVLTHVSYTGPEIRIFLI